MKPFNDNTLEKDESEEAVLNTRTQESQFSALRLRWIRL